MFKRLREIMTKHWFGRKKRGGARIVDGKIVSEEGNSSQTLEGQDFEARKTLSKGRKTDGKTSFLEGRYDVTNQRRNSGSGKKPRQKTEQTRARGTDKPRASEKFSAPESPGKGKKGRPPGWERFKNYLEAAKKAPRTIKEYHYELTWWEAEAKRQGKGIYTLKARNIERAVAKLQPATAKRKLAALKMYAKFLLREGWPALFEELEKCVRPKTPETLPKDLGPEEFLKLREKARALVAEGDRRGIWLGLMLLCGLRISEIATCRPAGREHIKVTGKGGKERLVPCPGWLIEALKRHRKEGRGGWAKHRAIIWAALARSGIRNPHALRHTYASELLRRGRSIEEIQYLLGHANIATTNIYARVRTPPDVLATLGE